MYGSVCSLVHFVSFATAGACLYDCSILKRGCSVSILFEFLRPVFPRYGISRHFGTKALMVRYSICFDTLLRPERETLSGTFVQDVFLPTRQTRPYCVPINEVFSLPCAATRVTTRTRRAGGRAQANRTLGSNQINHNEPLPDSAITIKITDGRILFIKKIQSHPHTALFLIKGRP